MKVTIYPSINDMITGEYSLTISDVTSVGESAVGGWYIICSDKEVLLPKDTIFTTTQEG